MILMIDNYDSFTYNIVQYLAELKAEVQVYRNDEISIADIERLAPEKIVISPGPCTPNEAGISVETITTSPVDCRFSESVLGIRVLPRPLVARLSAPNR